MLVAIGCLIPYLIARAVSQPQEVPVYAWDQVLGPAPVAVPVPPPTPRVTTVKRVESGVMATVTGYNTVVGQTDSTPCDAAGGPICGRDDVVACPSYLKLHSWVSIGGKRYECMDRTASKFNGRFDISCDKDMQCPYQIKRRQQVTIL